MHIKNNVPLSALSLAIISVLGANESWGAANFTITPAPGYIIPTTVPLRGTVSAFYTVTNNTHTTRSNYKIQGLPSTATQNSSNASYCPSPITLKGLASCTLWLNITGEAISNFSICYGSNCTTAAVPLHVTQSAALLNATVGFYRNNNDSVAALSYTSTNGGSTWVVSAPLPLPGDVKTTVTSQVSDLVSITCDSAAHCSAVGFYKNNDDGQAPLSYTSTDGGITWALSAPLLLPADVKTIPADQDNKLVSTTCDSAGHCSAVGFYKNNHDGYAPLSYTSTDGGITWALSAPLLLPADVKTTPADQDSVLSCVS